MLYGIIVALALALAAAVMVLVREARLRRALERFVRLVLGKEKRQ